MAKELVTIIDYGAGNIRSAAKACEHAISNAGLHMDVLISGNPNDILSADRIILPGQGAYGDCITSLRKSGLINALQSAIHQHKKPFLGICVGMQLLTSNGQEHGSHTGLDWIKGSVVPITPQDKSLKIPHMGWNDIAITRPHPVLKNIQSGQDFYFVHSYHAEISDPNALIATCNYGGDITAIIAKDNIIGTQFHPEKSADAGLLLIENFLKWDGSALHT